MYTSTSAHVALYPSVHSWACRCTCAPTLADLYALRETHMRACTHADTRSLSERPLQVQAEGPRHFPPLLLLGYPGTPHVGIEILQNPVGYVAAWLWSHGVTSKGSSCWRTSMRTKLRVLQTPRLASDQRLCSLLTRLPHPAMSTHTEASEEREATQPIPQGQTRVSLEVSSPLGIGTAVERQLQ